LLPEELTLREGEVVLRDWREGDESALEPLFGDPDVAPFSSLPPVYSPAAAREHVERLRARRAAGELLALAVTRNGGDPVGNVNLVFRFESSAEAALGYWITPAARGQGLAATATRLLARWGFDHLGLTRIELLIDPANTPSHRVAERLGATRVGLRTHEANGRTFEMVAYDVAAASLR
jgi:[ribosomal protein S5]-alanine N-acetyltransferase